MMNNYDSIRLFKKNRETDDTLQELLTKEDSPNSEQPVSDLIITPLVSKEKDVSSLVNSEQINLPPRITNVIQKFLTSFGINLKDNFSLDSLKDNDILRKLPIWLLKKPQ